MPYENFVRQERRIDEGNSDEKEKKKRKQKKKGNYKKKIYEPHNNPQCNGVSLSFSPAKYDMNHTQRTQNIPTLTNFLLISALLSVINKKRKKINKKNTKKIKQNEPTKR